VKKFWLALLSVILVTAMSGGAAMAAGGYLPFLFRQEGPKITVAEPLGITAVGGFVTPETTLMPGQLVLSTNFEVTNWGNLQYGILPVVIVDAPTDRPPWFTTKISAAGPGGGNYQTNDYGGPVLISPGQILNVTVQVFVAYDSVPGEAKVSLELHRVAPPLPNAGGPG